MTDLGNAWAAVGYGANLRALSLLRALPLSSLFSKSPFEMPLALKNEIIMATTYIYIAQRINFRDERISSLITEIESAKKDSKIKDIAFYPPTPSVWLDEAKENAFRWQEHCQGK